MEHECKTILSTEETQQAIKEYTQKHYPHLPKAKSVTFRWEIKGIQWNRYAVLTTITVHHEEKKG